MSKQTDESILQPASLEDSIDEDSELEVSCMLQALKEKVDVFKDDMEARETEEDIVDEVDSLSLDSKVVVDYAEAKQAKQSDIETTRASKELALMQGKIGNLLQNLQDAAAKVGESTHSTPASALCHTARMLTCVLPLPCSCPLQADAKA